MSTVDHNLSNFNPSCSPDDTTTLTKFKFQNGTSLQDRVNDLLNGLNEHNLRTVIVIVGLPLGDEFLAIGHVDQKRLPETFESLKQITMRERNRRITEEWRQVSKRKSS